MVYIPNYLLPQLPVKDVEKIHDRWISFPDGQALQKAILEKIKAGAGEDFLQVDFEAGRLGFIEHQWDLKGFPISGVEIDFPKNDNFEAINFSYANFSNSIFRKAYFRCNFSFIYVMNCEFTSCTFHLSSFYGASLKNVIFKGCDFIGKTAFTHTSCSNVKFNDCYFEENIFIDCKFDENTEIALPIRKISASKDNSTFEEKQFAEIYKGIKEAYLSGGVTSKSRDYFFRQRQAISKFNKQSVHNIHRLTDFLFVELLTGYGIRPFCPLIAMFIWFLIVLLIFSSKVGMSDGIILTSGALFTFGANAELLKNMGFIYIMLYVITSFLGISLTALFITIMANVWLNDR
ncbi:MAG: pentapeptide repeat-containing protein [Candidatus Margulisiibacteriota bacterium]